MPRSKTPWKRPTARHSSVTPAELRAWIEARDGTAAQVARALGKNMATIQRYLTEEWAGRIPVEVELLMRLSKHEPDILRELGGGPRPWNPNIDARAEKRKLERTNVEQ